MTAVLPPLKIGRHTFISPVVLAPMAGITNRAFRRLCRQYGDAGLGQATGAGGTPVSGATWPAWTSWSYTVTKPGLYTVVAEVASGAYLGLDAVTLAP